MFTARYGLVFNNFRFIFKVLSSSDHPQYITCPMRHNHECCDLKIWVHKARGAKFCLVAHNIFGFSEWNLNQQLRILKWLLEFFFESWCTTGLKE